MEKIFFNPYKVVENDDNKYIYLSRTGAIYKLDQITEKILDLQKQNKIILYKNLKQVLDISELELDENIQEYKKIGLIRNMTMNNKLTVHFDITRVTGMMLIVSQLCNMSCDYCYSKDGVCRRGGLMTWHIAKKAVDELFDKSNALNITISFFGGEPLLNFEVIKKTVIYAEKRAHENNKNIQFAITTNATLVTQQIADFIKEHRFSINVSVDGNKVTHDLHRKYKNGEGTYDDVVNGLKKMSGNLVTIRSTMTPGENDIRDVLAESSKYAVNDSFVACAYETIRTKDDFFLIISKYHDAIESFYDDVKRKDYDKCRGNKTIYNILYRYANFHNRIAYCDALLRGITIDVNGDIYPCHRFCNIEESVVGNIKDDLNYDCFNNFINSFLLENRNKCESCWAFNICGGNCSYINYYFNKNCEEPAEIVCKINKIVFEEVLNLFVKLTVDEKRNLKL